MKGKGVMLTCVFRRNGAARDAMRGGDSEAHNFQEYTYKKITPCDVCSQVLRGKGILIASSNGSSLIENNLFSESRLWNKQGSCKTLTVSE